MAVSTDIVRTWRGPRTVVRGLLAQGVREDRALVFLMTGLVIVWLSNLPVLQRGAVLTGSDLRRDAIYAFFGLVMLAPLIFYLLAFLGRLLALAAGRPVSGYGSRLALFWAWLAASPAVLLYGLLAGLNGPAEPGTRLVGALWLAAFAWFWIAGLAAASAASASATASGPAR